MRCFPATALVVAASAALAPFVVACSTLLGLDEQLTETSDASAGGQDGAVGSHLDATVGDASSSAGDGGLFLDGASRPDGAQPGGSVWHVDRYFADAGYLALGIPDGVRASGLQLLHRDADEPLIVGVSAKPSLVFYTASQSDPVATFAADDPAFGGAIVLPSGQIDALTVSLDTRVTTFFVPADLGSSSAAVSLQTNLVFARVIDFTASQGLHSVGSVQPGAGAPVAADIYQQGTLLSAVPLPDAISSMMTLAKSSLTTLDGTTYYAGICVEGCGGVPVAAYGSVTDGGVPSGGVVTLATPTEGAGLTDLLAVDGGVYAVGFDDHDFVLATLSANDTFVPLGSISADGPDDETYFSTNAGQLTAETQLLGAYDGTRILVGGSFDGVKLAAFALDGGHDRLALADTADGGISYPGVLDLADYLPSAGAGASWFFQTMLLEGNYLYVTASTPAADDAKWVVLRLVNSALP